MNYIKKTKIDLSLLFLAFLISTFIVGCNSNQVEKEDVNPSSDQQEVPSEGQKNPEANKTPIFILDKEIFVSTKSSIAEGFYNSTQFLELLCKTDTGVDCTIYYTLDGTEPTSLSKMYSSSIVVDQSITISFKAYAANNKFASATQLIKIQIEKQAPTVGIISEIKELSNIEQVVDLVCDDDGSGCNSIFYTINDPNISTNSNKYNKAILISESSILRYFSIDNAGNQSEIRQIDITIDRQSPNVLDIQPENNSMINDLSALVIASFNEPLDQSTVNGDNVRIEGIEGSFKYDVDKYSIVFTPDQPYLPGNTYKVSISNITDLAGNKIENTFNSNFILKDTIPLDDQVPSVTIVSEIHKLPKREQLIELMCDDGVGSGCKSIFYTLNDSSISTNSHKYENEILINESSILRYFSIDNAGNQSEIKQINITIDRQSPVVLDIQPENNTAISDLSALIIASFNEPLDQSTINSDNIKIEGMTGSIEYDADENAIIFAPDQPYMSGNSYKVSISNVTDLAGNQIQNSFESIFNFNYESTQINSRTEPDSSAAHVVFQNNGDGIAVWVAEGGKNNSVLGAFFSAATQEWSKEFVIGVERSNNPQLADVTSFNNPGLVVSTCRGGYMVAWQDSHLYSRIFDGSKWQEVVEQGRGYNVLDLNISVSNNSCLLTWDGDKVFANMYGDEGWSGVKALNPDGDYNSGQLRLIGSDGEFLVTWLAWMEGHGYPDAYFAKVYDGTWSSTQRIDNLSGDVSSGSLLKMTDGYVFIFKQVHEGRSKLFFRMFEDGSWSDSQLLDGTGTVKFVSKINNESYGFLREEVKDTKNVLSVSIFNGIDWIFDSEVHSSETALDISLFKLVKQGGAYIALWRQTNGIYQELYSSQYNGETWSTPQIIAQRAEVETDLDKNSFKIVKQGIGLVAVWRQKNGTSRSSRSSFEYYDLYSIRFDGESWSSPQAIEQLTGTVSSQSIVLVEGLDDTTVFWKQSEFDNEHSTRAIYSATSSTSGWKKEKKIISRDGGLDVLDEWYGASKFFSGEKNGVSWAGVNGSHVTVVDEQNLESTSVLSTDVFGGSVSFIKYAQNSNNDLMVTWIQSELGEGTLFSKIRKKGVWGDIEKVGENLTVTGEYYEVASGNEFFIVSWGTKKSEIYAATYANNSWGVSKLLAQGSNNTYIAASANSAVLVWQDRESLRGDIFLRGAKYSIESGWEQTKTIANHSRVIENIQIKEVEDKYLVLWTEDNRLSYHDINYVNYSSYFADDWSEPMLINKGENGASYAKIAANENTFLVSWAEKENLFTRFWLTDKWSETEVIASNGLRDLTLASGKNSFIALWNDDQKLRSRVYINDSWSVEEELGDRYISYDGLKIATTDNKYAVSWMKTGVSRKELYVKEFSDGWKDTTVFTSSGYIQSNSIVSISDSYSLFWESYENEILSYYYSELEGSSWSIPKLKTFNGKNHKNLLIPNRNMVEILSVQENSSDEVVRNVWIDTMQQAQE